MSYSALVEAALGTGKPVIVSVGGRSFDEITAFSERYKKHAKQMTLLYCCNAYPSRHYDLRWIEAIRNATGFCVGYSCHSTDIYPAISAVKDFAAPVVEKHVAICEMDTPDYPHSVDFVSFNLMCNAIRGDDALVPLEAWQSAAKLTHNRRLMATSPINIGDALTVGMNVGYYRAKHHQIAYVVDADLKGKRATRPFNPGEAITMNGFK